MALRLKKDVKKSSYYVWFLGAQESRGLRGDEYALPAIERLERRARDLDPFKVTLQVSHKGLKIIQNVAPKGKQQTIKHFIPHGSITSVVLRGDVVACVLLLFNPVTRCPIHVHAYRCDSDRTAEMLCAHLQALIDRPENQKKFADIERKLQSKGALPGPKKNPDSSLGSEVSTRESESGSSEERCVATLYDSLAAELKQKLSTGKSPILLPPRDYDTVHRQKGNLSGIDTRRCLNQNIVGVNARRKLESSGGSSGIGSDLAPSPDQNEYSRQHDNQSTSEEEWNESTAYMMHEAYEMSPPRRALSPPREPYEPYPRTFDRRQRRDSPDRAHRYADKLDKYVDSMDKYADRYAEKADKYTDGKLDKYADRYADKVDKYVDDKLDKYPDRYADKADKYVDGKLDAQNYADAKIDKYADRYAEVKADKYADRYVENKIDTYADRFVDGKTDKYVDKAEKYGDDGPHYRRRFVPEPLKQLNRSVDRIDERLDERPRGDERRRDPYRPTLQRGISEGSLKVADTSPKDRFHVAKEKFMNLERERFNRELEKHMQLRRSMLERTGRSGSSPEEDERPERPRRDELDRPRRDEFERPRRDEPERQRQLPRVGRKEPRRYEPPEEQRPGRRELDRRVDEDEMIEPVIEERRRRDWADRQRAFSRSRLVEEARLSAQEFPHYAPHAPHAPHHREYRDLPDREPAQFRHSYAEPALRSRLGVAALRPY